MQPASLARDHAGDSGLFLYSHHSQWTAPVPQHQNLMVPTPQINPSQTVKKCQCFPSLILYSSAAWKLDRSSDIQRRLNCRKDGTIDKKINSESQEMIAAPLGHAIKRKDQGLRLGGAPTRSPTWSSRTSSGPCISVLPFVATQFQVVLETLHHTAA